MSRLRQRFHFAVAMALVAALGDAGVFADHAQLELLNATQFPEARCMDGSPGGYYLARNKTSTAWVVELQGGGECATQKLCDAVASRGSPLASSDYFPSTHSMSYYSVDDPVGNPLLRHWNRLFIPYCSQDLWTGTRTTARSDTWGYYFSGHIILESILDHLKLSMSNATDIVFTGVSAGGIGVWPNVDWLAERLPHARGSAGASSTARSSARRPSTC